jgi:hypothetical protein
MQNYQGWGKPYLITLTETLIILHIARTEFNNCFMIHLFVLNRYRLLIIAGSTQQITEFSVGCSLVAWLRNLTVIKLLANQIAFTNYNLYNNVACQNMSLLNWTFASLILRTRCCYFCQFLGFIFHLSVITTLLIWRPKGRDFDWRKDSTKL